MRTTALEGRPAAFLDRDGVINVDRGYEHQCEGLTLTATAAEGIRLLNEASYSVIVVTNQSGVARGFFKEADVHRYHACLADRLKIAGARIDAFYHAPFHPHGTVAAFAIDHEDRKPGAGMIRRATHDWSVQLEGSFVIGDQPSDAEAAQRVGLPALLLSTNTGDLQAAVQLMLTRHARPR